jgi:hypothetical protein
MDGGGGGGGRAGVSRLGAAAARRTVRCGAGDGWTVGSRKHDARVRGRRGRGSVLCLVPVRQPAVGGMRARRRRRAGAGRRSTTGAAATSSENGRRAGRGHARRLLIHRCGTPDLGPSPPARPRSNTAARWCHLAHAVASRDPACIRMPYPPALPTPPCRMPSEHALLRRTGHGSTERPRRLACGGARWRHTRRHAVAASGMRCGRRPAGRTDGCLAGGRTDGRDRSRTQSRPEAVGTQSRAGMAGSRVLAVHVADVVPSRACGGPMGRAHARETAGRCATIRVPSYHALPQRCTPV